MVVARWLFDLLGAIWFVLGVVSLVRMYTGDTSFSSFGWIIALLMFVNSAVLIWIGWGIGKGLKIYFYLAILVLAGNIILTLTDEFGLIDLITLIVNIGLLVLLLVTRAKFNAES